MNPYEETEIEGYSLKIWSPKKCPGFTISDGGGWLDGVFDSRESAIEGFKLSLSPNGYCLLAGLNRRVCHITRENRLITLDDLARLALTPMQ